MNGWNVARLSAMGSDTSEIIHRPVCREFDGQALATRNLIESHPASEYVALSVTPAVECDISHVNPASLASLGRMESRFAAIFINHPVGEIQHTAKLPLPGKGLFHLNLSLCATWCDLHSGSGPNYGPLADSAIHAEVVTMWGQWSGRGLPAS